MINTMLYQKSAYDSARKISLQKFLCLLIVLYSCTMSKQTLACESQHAHAEARPANANIEAVSVSNAYVRGLPPGQKVTAAFMSLSNTAEQALTLQSVSSPVAEKAERHETSQDGVQMQMRKLSTLSIAAGETVIFEPGGKHIMLMGLQQSLKQGDTVELRLCFVEFCKIIQAPVVSVLNEAKGQHKQNKQKQHQDMLHHHMHH